MTSRTERVVDARGLRMKVIEQGRGPLVLFLHGFPGLAEDWGAYLGPLAAAGYRAVAPTQRGYPGTGRPLDIAEYTTLHLVGDLVSLLEVLGESSAAIVGHDWGAVIAWQCALMRPDLFRAVFAMSNPYQPRGSVCPTERIRGFVGDTHFYALHFQTPGVAEADFGRMGIERGLRRILHGASGDAHPDERWRPSGPAGMPFFEGTVDPPVLPGWMEEILKVYVPAFGGSGLTGPLNWYRAMDLSWTLTSPFASAPVTVPSMFVYGDRDPLVRYVSRAITHLGRSVPMLRGNLPIPGAGHWMHLERAPLLTDAVLRFLRDEGI